MKVKSIEAKDVPPVKQFSVDDLSNVVVLAGPNGVGKTRLVQEFLQAFRAGRPNIRFVIEATSRSELDSWGKSLLDTSIAEDAANEMGK